MNTVQITIESLRRPNFSPHEFFQSDTARKLGIDNYTNDLCLLTAGMRLADKLQEIRNKTNKAVKLTNAYRCPALNDAVGGSKSSWHMQFLAADLNIGNLSPLEAVQEIKELGISIDKCFVERGCVHLQTCMDDRKNRNVFGYAEKIFGEWAVTPL